MEQRGKVIIVTGIIGAGKSSLSRELAQELGGLFLSEPDEKAAATGSNPYLSDFYADQSRWALTMQLHLLGIEGVWLCRIHSECTEAMAPVLQRQGDG